MLPGACRKYQELEDRVKYVNEVGNALDTLAGNGGASEIGTKVKQNYLEDQAPRQSLEVNKGV